MRERQRCSRFVGALTPAGPCTQVVVGTPPYMCPELILGRCLDLRACDVWAFGCTLLELATGTTPWSGTGLHDAVPLMRHIAQCGHAPPASRLLSADLVDLLQQCFAPEGPRLTASQLLRHKWLSPPSARPLRIVRSTVLLPTIALRRAGSSISDTGAL